MLRAPAESRKVNPAGVATASPAFLVRTCLRRRGRVYTSGRDVVVELAPAALDVVLEMAGYLRAVESVPWLEGRSVTFRVSRDLEE